MDTEGDTPLDPLYANAIADGTREVLHRLLGMVDRGIPWSDKLRAATREAMRRKQQLTLEDYLRATQPHVTEGEWAVDPVLRGLPVKGASWER